MSTQQSNLRKDVKSIFFWTYAAVVLSTWALIGFVPISGASVADASIGYRLLHGVFLVTGFVGFIGAYVVYLFIRVPSLGQDRKKSIAVPLTVYATAWLIAYWAFSWLA